MSTWMRPSFYSPFCRMCYCCYYFFLLLAAHGILGEKAENGPGEQEQHQDLPNGLIRSPLLQEHSFGAPIVTDWWEEGVPHFIISGSAVANEKFIRLTTNNFGDHGFAFNTAPCDHSSWEVRLRFSIRPPLPTVRAREQAKLEGKQTTAEEKEMYQGGEGMALWYLEHPLSDDRQHVPKYSKPIDPDAAAEEEMRRDPARVADLLLHQGSEEDEDTHDTTGGDGGSGTGGETEGEREQRRVARLSRKHEREEMYRRVLTQGTSTDDSKLEPRILGLKYSDFRGFGILLDSLGHSEEEEEAESETHPREPKNGSGKNVSKHKKEHKAHDPQIMLLLNLPSKEGAVNNFSPRRMDFRSSPVRLQCRYNFQQSPTQRAVQMGLRTATNQQNVSQHQHGDKQNMPLESATEEEELLRKTPEDPVELVVRYHKRRLTVIITRENVSRRRVVRAAAEPLKARGNAQDGRGHPTYRVEKTYVDTLCGEIDDIDLPLNYYFGISASTGVQKRSQSTATRAEGNGENTPPSRETVMQLLKESYTPMRSDRHVDVHDVVSFELRELGKDAKKMGYSKSIPIEHFDYEADRREREHFSRQLPVEPED